MNNSKIHSLKWRLIISFFLLVIIPTSIIGIFSYLISYRAIEEKISVYSYQIMQQTTNNLDKILSNIEDISLQIISTRDIQGVLNRARKAGPTELNTINNTLNDMLKNIITSRQEVIGVNIFMKDINHAFIFGDPLIDIENYKEQAIYINSLQANGKLIWTGTYENKNPIVTYKHITTLSRKIIDVSTGEVLGVLVVGIKEFALADTYSYLDLGPSGFTFVVDEKGSVISHLNKRSLSKKAGYSFVDIITEDKTNSLAFADYVDNEKVLVSYSKSKYTNWIMISVVPYKYLIKEITSTGFLTLKIGVIFMIISLISALLISFSIFKPIKRLSEDMAMVEEGDLSIRTMIRGKNEVSKLAYGFNAMIERIENLVTKNYEAQLMEQEAQINALQSQINPHFLYNTLAVIDGMALKIGEKEIANVSQILADIFRYSTNGSELATIEEEFIQTEKYLRVHKYRKQDKLTYSLSLNENVKDLLLPKLIIQPIVENAIIHGIDKKRDGGHISVAAIGNNKILSIVVEDNGIGMDEKRLIEVLHHLKEDEEMKKYWSSKTRHYIGISNVNNRIKNYYGKQFGLSIESDFLSGTKITITIPVSDMEFKDEGLVM